MGLSSLCSVKFGVRYWGPYFEGIPGNPNKVWLHTFWGSSGGGGGSCGVGT